MSILIDSEIKENIKIEGASWELVSKKEIWKSRGTESRIISYGLSSFGYDARLDSEFLIYSEHNQDNMLIDPYNIKDSSFIKLEVKNDSVTNKEYIIIPPNSFVLGKTVEKFEIPQNVFAICVGKSTYARCGIIVNVTPLEPGWSGYVTLELSNTTRLPAKVYVNEGICQFIFFKSEKKPWTTYSDRKGKYMNQEHVTPPKV